MVVRASVQQHSDCKAQMPHSAVIEIHNKHRTAHRIKYRKTF